MCWPSGSRGVVWNWSQCAGFRDQCSSCAVVKRSVNCDWFPRNRSRCGTSNLRLNCVFSLVLELWPARKVFTCLLLVDDHILCNCRVHRLTQWAMVRDCSVAYRCILLSLASGRRHQCLFSNKTETNNKSGCECERLDFCDLRDLRVLGFSKSFDSCWANEFVLTEDVSWLAGPLVWHRSHSREKNVTTCGPTHSPDQVSAQNYSNNTVVPWKNVNKTSSYGGYLVRLENKMNKNRISQQDFPTSYMFVFVEKVKYSLSIYYTFQTCYRLMLSGFLTLILVFGKQVHLCSFMSFLLRTGRLPTIRWRRWCCWSWVTSTPTCSFWWDSWKDSTAPWRSTRALSECKQEDDDDDDDHAVSTRRKVSVDTLIWFCDLGCSRFNISSVCLRFLLTRETFHHRRFHVLLFTINSTNEADCGFVFSSSRIKLLALAFLRHLCLESSFWSPLYHNQSIFKPEMFVKRPVLLVHRITTDWRYLGNRQVAQTGFSEL